MWAKWHMSDTKSQFLPQFLLLQIKDNYEKRHNKMTTKDTYDYMWFI